jgi:hypothetical protein
LESTASSSKALFQFSEVKEKNMKLTFVIIGALLVLMVAIDSVGNSEIFLA